MSLNSEFGKIIRGSIFEVNELQSRNEKMCHNNLYIAHDRDEKDLGNIFSYLEITIDVLKFLKAKRSWMFGQPI